MVRFIFCWTLEQLLHAQPYFSIIMYFLHIITYSLLVFSPSSANLSLFTTSFIPSQSNPPIHLEIHIKMVQTRRQAASRALDRIITGFLKEVRILAPQKVEKTFSTHQRKDSITTEDKPIYSSANAPAHLSATSKLFNAMHLPLRLYAPPAINTECIQLFYFLERSVFAAICGPSIMDFMLADKPNQDAVRYVLEGCVNKLD